MRLITDSEHAQIVEALERLKKLQGWKPFVTEDETDTWVPAEHQALEALATLQALPEVGVVGKVTDETSAGFHVEFYQQTSKGVNLYATKEPS